MPSEIDAAREALYQAIALLEKTGATAPAGTSITPYFTTKTRKDGSKVQHRYFKLEADKPIFQGDRAGKTKYLHLGKQGSEKYQDWRGRIARRNVKSAIEWAMQELATLEELHVEDQDT
ncbi:hypothetical protein NIES2135_61280 (plasmid) [Leptolyngbya boryana NIES-2135]|jgi:hypothetical protein|uniref:Uncharacterized protein n=1 Tax=Leptolyngbya boryana NIES-2135 TaxID=1973484 RepID=A0A1Z4JR61_LEPBY|nr:MULTISPECIES: hypothetical protein [Leptolyngbya]BAY59251.1 hypothetical protein NIES2135_61280 [Leptolyngbya boryana NIES-2135]MBD2372840.1 hypothetical protein [Leptolyngbya sp. FACHB-238]MBD2397407.1 hypothetical protein [Leptolyngbya sp. FACHB-239]MBD2403788.1 hypothetical protein [Leptolyngbya sp. FACHB-402]ULP33444.1 hypothetical protein MCP04_30410 [Leptolyngbya boryana IU 594]